MEAFVRNAEGYFNPRSPHGERHFHMEQRVTVHMISIHAPRTGSDRFYSFFCAGKNRFQSTLPARGATLLV